MIKPGHILRNRYEILELIGRGGMADVYLAFDRRRMVQVAIKILREDLAEDPDFLRRFAREAQALARLDHPNIVRFFSFEREGLTAFIVLEYVDGVTLRRRLAERGGPLGLDETTAILRQIASALHYAHNEGFIHRDLKPGNVMIDRHGRALLTDFGIAKALESATVTTMAVGTPAYMSPEQILGQELDARTDIYSLGVMLFQMVTGRRPFTGEEPGLTGTGTLARLRDAHLHATPPRPSQLNPALPPEVDEVILRALAKKREARWQNVASLLRAWEAAVGEEPTIVMPRPQPQPEPQPAIASPAPQTPPSPPVEPPSDEAVPSPAVPERESKPRQGLWAFVGIVLVAAVIVLTVAGLWWRSSIEKQAVGAVATVQVPTATEANIPAMSQAQATFRANATTAVLAKATAIAMLTATAQAQAQATTEAIRTATAQARAIAEAKATKEAMATVTKQARATATAQAKATAEAAKLPVQAGTPVSRTTEAISPQNANRVRSLARWEWEKVLSIAFSPDGQILASGSRNGAVRVWRVFDGTPLYTKKEHTHWVTSVAFSPDGQILASGSMDEFVRLWRVSDGTLIRTLERLGPVFSWMVESVAFSPDGRILASGLGDGTVRLRRVSDGALTQTLGRHGAKVTSVAFSPDGRTIASASGDHTVRLWRVSDGALLYILEGHKSAVNSVAFSPDGRILASGGYTIRLWRVSDGALLYTLEGHKSAVNSVAFSPDSKLLASGSDDGTVKIWRMADGQLLRTLKGHSSWVMSVAFSPDGKLLASGADDGTVRLWGVLAEP